MLFLTIGKISSGQYIQPTKQELINVFRKSILQTSKTEIHVDSNPWIMQDLLRILLLGRMLADGPFGIFHLEEDPYV